MGLFKKKSLHKKTKHNEKVRDSMIPRENKKCIQEINFKAFVGQTVTLYVNAGGDAGRGFTGVLLGQSSGVVRLLVLPKAAPLCTLGNACKGINDNIMFCLFCPYNKKVSLGSIAEISISSIVAFVHNNYV